MHRFAALLLVLCGQSCAWTGNGLVEETSGETFRRPRFVQRSEEGTVRAYDEDLALRASQALASVQPRVQRLLGHQAALPEVWILDRKRVAGSDAIYLKGKRRSVVVVGSGALEHLEYTLAHELSHWYSQSSDVALPVVVEEGLADLVAMVAVPLYVEPLLKVRQADSNPTVWTRAQALELSFEEWSALPEDEESQLRSIGFLLALNLGLENLRALCETARSLGLDRVPAEWFLGQGPGAAYPRLR